MQRLVDNLQGREVLIHVIEIITLKYFKYIFDKINFFDFLIEFENYPKQSRWWYTPNSYKDGGDLLFFTYINLN